MNLIKVPEFNNINSLQIDMDVKKFLSSFGDTFLCSEDLKQLKVGVMGSVVLVGGILTVISMEICVFMLIESWSLFNATISTIVNVDNSAQISMLENALNVFDMRNSSNLTAIQGFQYNLEHLPNSPEWVKNMWRSEIDKLTKESNQAALDAVENNNKIRQLKTETREVVTPNAYKHASFIIVTLLIIFGVLSLIALFLVSVVFDID